MSLARQSVHTGSVSGPPWVLHRINRTLIGRGEPRRKRAARRDQPACYRTLHADFVQWNDLWSARRSRWASNLMDALHFRSRARPALKRRAASHVSFSGFAQLRSGSDPPASRGSNAAAFVWMMCCASFIISAGSFISGKYPFPTNLMHETQCHPTRHQGAFLSVRSLA
jgi:hypothetical protein